MGVITFNGVSSDSLGIVVETPPNYEIPERDYEEVEVPGRNGPVLIDKGNFKNVDREYNIAIGQLNGDYAALSNKIATWLYGGYGYLRLEDSYEPLYYKMAKFVGPVNISNILQQAGRVTVTFNRKPQRFLKSGDTEQSFSTTGSITNPTGFPAKPLIVISGSGTGKLTIGGKYTVAISNMSSAITLDCEVEDAYNGTANLNALVTCAEGFPILVGGANAVKIEGGITGVRITPRWWTI